MPRLQFSKHAVSFSETVDTAVPSIVIAETSMKFTRVDGLQYGTGSQIWVLSGSNNPNGFGKDLPFSSSAVWSDGYSTEMTGGEDGPCLDATMTDPTQDANACLNN